MPGAAGWSGRNAPCRSCGRAGQSLPGLGLSGPCVVRSTAWPRCAFPEATTRNFSPGSGWALSFRRGAGCSAPHSAGPWAQGQMQGASSCAQGRGLQVPRAGEQKQQPCSPLLGQPGPQSPSQMQSATGGIQAVEFKGGLNPVLPRGKWRASGPTGSAVQPAHKGICSHTASRASGSGADPHLPATWF